MHTCLDLRGQGSTINKITRGHLLLFCGQIHQNIRWNQTDWICQPAIETRFSQLWLLFLSMTWCEPLILRRGHIWSIRPDIIFWGKMLTFPSKFKARLFLQANEARTSEAWLLATSVTELLRQWKTWTTTSNKTREYEATELTKVKMNHPWTSKSDLLSWKLLDKQN